jgi:hypothetical protein
MVSIIEFYDLQRRVSALEGRIAPQSSRVFNPITLLLESVNENVKSVNSRSLLQYLEQDDIFVRIYVHNGETGESSTSFTDASTYYEHFIVNPNYTVLVLSRNLTFFENINTIFLDHEKNVGLYFTDSSDNVPTTFDGVYFIINSQQVSTNLNLIRRRVGGTAVDVYNNKNSVCNIKVKFLGDITTTTPITPEESFESFGVGNLQPQNQSTFDDGGDR